MQTGSKKTSFMAPLFLCAGILGIGFSGPGVPGFAQIEPEVETVDGTSVVDQVCTACHEKTDAGIYRIDGIRKSPEGWDLTLRRMQLWHHVELTPGEHRAALKHLADTRGLAPEEAQDYRYLLERRSHIVEEFPSPKIGTVCARCHSYGRIALQRRDEDEWRRLVHMHLGQWPSIDMHGAARDIQWRSIALDELPQWYAEHYPLETDAWSDWQRADKPSPVGRWRLAGDQPGTGRYTGYLEITESDSGSYGVEMSIRYANGGVKEGSGSGQIYTGYEWRGSLTLGGGNIRQAFALSKDGQAMVGRWFFKEHREQGAEFQAYRIRVGGSGIVSVEPPALKAGATAIVTVSGFGLDDTLNLGDGIEVLEILEDDRDKMIARVSVAADATLGYRVISNKDATLENSFAIYEQISRIQVTPGYALGRIGGAGTPVPTTNAQFSVIAWSNGADGIAGNEDDLNLGRQSAEWSVEPWDEIAASYDDVRFAGTMRPDGLFVPAGPGPNPERINSANNMGHLRVIATVMDGDRQLNGAAELIVSAPKWVNPPIE